MLILLILGGLSLLFSVSWGGSLASIFILALVLVCSGLSSNSIIEIRYGRAISEFSYGLLSLSV